MRDQNWLQDIEARELAEFDRDLNTWVRQAQGYQRMTRSLYGLACSLFLFGLGVLFLFIS